tara:strand:- start:284 stop:598 length:315 start_codon:yes stop_codon:yes gene_type:complete
LRRRLENIRITSLTRIDLDITKGGFSPIFLSSYSRMLGDPKRSLITAIRGSPNRLLCGLGMVYIFPAAWCQPSELIDFRNPPLGQVGGRRTQSALLPTASGHSI